MRSFQHYLTPLPVWIHELAFPQNDVRFATDNLPTSREDLPTSKVCSQRSLSVFFRLCKICDISVKTFCTILSFGKHANLPCLRDHLNYTRVVGTYISYLKNWSIKLLLYFLLKFKIILKFCKGLKGKNTVASEMYNLIFCAYFKLSRESYSTFVQKSFVFSLLCKWKLTRASTMNFQW